MFEAFRNLSDGAADALDLFIDFATLGEYGLEPVDEPRSLHCEGRHRPRYEAAAPSGRWMAAIERFS